MLPRKNVAMNVSLMKNGDSIKLSKHDLAVDQNFKIYVNIWATETENLPDALLQLSDGNYYIYVYEQIKIKMHKAVDQNSHIETEFVRYMDQITMADC